MTACMCITVIIAAAPAFDPHGRQLHGKFNAMLGDLLLVGSTRQPLLDGARHLLALGYPPDTAVVMRHAGSGIDSLRSTMGAAAALTVDETGTPRFARWKPYLAEAVAAPIAPNDSALTCGPSARRRA